MDFNEYQVAASKTAIYPELYNVLYPALGLAGEAGEVANKVKKVIRDGLREKLKEGDEELNNAVVVVTKALKDLFESPKIKDAISSELQGVLWYISQTAMDLNIPLNQIAQENIEVLSSRQERGVIGGSGDNR